MKTVNDLENTLVELRVIENNGNNDIITKVLGQIADEINDELNAIKRGDYTEDEISDYCTRWVEGKNLTINIRL